MNNLHDLDLSVDNEERERRREFIRRSVDRLTNVIRRVLKNEITKEQARELIKEGIAIDLAAVQGSEVAGVPE